MSNWEDDKMHVWYITPYTFRSYKGHLEGNRVVFKNKKMHRIFNSGKCKSIPVSFGDEGVFGNRHDAAFYQIKALQDVCDISMPVKDKFKPVEFELRNEIDRACFNKDFVDKKVLKNKKVKAFIAYQLQRDSDEEEDEDESNYRIVRKK